MTARNDATTLSAPLLRQTRPSAVGPVESMVSRSLVACHTAPEDIAYIIQGHTAVCGTDSDRMSGRQDGGGGGRYGSTAPAAKNTEVSKPAEEF